MKFYLYFICLLFYFYLTYSYYHEFLVFADIHYDPKYSPYHNATTICREIANCPTKMDSLHIKLEEDPFNNYNVGRYGCDSNDLLLQSLYSYIRHIHSPIPKFILVLGDWAGHCTETYDLLISKIRHASIQLENSISNIPIIPIFGNNDLHPHNDMIMGPSELLDTLADMWSPWLSPQEQNEFRYCGYYTTKPVKGLKIIAMNTLLYHTHYCPYNTSLDKQLYCEGKKVIDTLPDDPCEQFQWLENELILAINNNEKVYIVSHIGPQRGKEFKSQWAKKFQNFFYDLTLQYYNVIEGLLFGHIHYDSMALLDKHNLSEGDPMKPIYAVPAITPYDNSNPAFRTYQYDIESFKLLDYKSFYMDLHYIQSLNIEWTPQKLAYYWQLEYQFTKSYNVPDISDSSLLDIYERMYYDPILLKHYIHLYFNLAPTVLIPMDKFICAIHKNNSYCD